MMGSGGVACVQTSPVEGNRRRLHAGSGEKCCQSGLRKEWRRNYLEVLNFYTVCKACLTCALILTTTTSKNSQMYRNTKQTKYSYLYRISVWLFGGADRLSLLKCFWFCFFVRYRFKEKHGFQSQFHHYIQRRMQWTASLLVLKYCIFVKMLSKKFSNPDQVWVSLHPLEMLTSLQEFLFSWLKQFSWLFVLRRLSADFKSLSFL